MIMTTTHIEVTPKINKDLHNLADKIHSLSEIIKNTKDPSERIKLTRDRIELECKLNHIINGGK